MIRGSRRIVVLLLAVALPGSCARFGDPYRSGGVELVLDAVTDSVPARERDTLVQRTVEVLAARLRAVAGRATSATLASDGTIHVRLPGHPDALRLSRLVGSAGRLEFVLVRPSDQAAPAFRALDAWCAARLATAGGRPRPAAGERYISDDGRVREADQAAVATALRSAPYASCLPAGTRVRWALPDTVDGEPVRTLYLLADEASMQPGDVASAEAVLGLDMLNPHAWGVSMKMTPGGRSRFAEVTGRQVGHQLAIVYDDVVQSAPIIRDRIPSGDASITGHMDLGKATDMAIVLNSGPLPLVLRAREKRDLPPR